jgi:hypothetical protein
VCLVAQKKSRDERVARETALRAKYVCGQLAAAVRQYWSAAADRAEAGKHPETKRRRSQRPLTLRQYQKACWGLAWEGRAVTSFSFRNQWRFRQAVLREFVRLSSSC